MKVEWSVFKNFVDQRTLSIQWLDLGRTYWLKAFDGNFSLESELDRDPSDTADLTDFETNYKDSGNKTPTAQVTTQFEKRDKTLKLVHAEGDVDTETGLITIDLKVPGTPGTADGRWISSGMAFFDVHTPGDKVLGVYFVDKDNMLGYGANFVVGSYTDDDADEINRGWAIPPIGWVKAEAIGGYGFAPSGFYVRVAAKKSGDSPTGKFYCNLEWGKNE